MPDAAPDLRDPAPHYREQRLALTDLLRGLSPQQLQTAVPGCPSWSVQDVVAHLVGLTASVCSGDMEEAGSPAWTQRQVDERAGRPVAEVLEEWTARAEGFEAQLPGMGFLGWVFTFDVTLHADDVREALGLPLEEGATGVAVLRGLLGRAATRAQGLGTLTLRAGDRVFTVGEGEPHATLQVAGVGEANRVVGDRRDDEAMRALSWTGDAEPWVRALPLFRGQAPDAQGE
jgi:uncharacterized protein (TIGR03083 family)